MVMGVRLACHSAYWGSGMSASSGTSTTPSIASMRGAAIAEAEVDACGTGATVEVDACGVGAATAADACEVEATVPSSSAIHSNITSLLGISFAHAPANSF